MAQIGLQRPGIDAVIGELEAACVPQHVRMNRETEIGGNPKPRDHLRNPAGVNGAPRSDVKMNGAKPVSTQETLN